jgi:6-phospho-beta-glucosidase
MKKITVIGGGSTYTPELMEGLINHHEKIGLEEVYLLDLKASDKFPIVAQLCERMLQKQGNPFRLKYGFEVKDAMTDSNFVVQQYRPGLLEGRINDEKIPLKYNSIGQETTGVGGFACALRAMPMIEGYIEAVERWAARDAFVINFTNPSGLLSEFVINTLGFERFAGLCNIPINMIQMAADRFDCEREDIFLNYYGLNHMSWIDAVKVKGIDRTSEALSDVYKPENIPESAAFEEAGQNLNMILNAYLRYYYTTTKMLEEEKEAVVGKGTRGELVKEIERELVRKYADLSLDEKPEELTQRGGSMYSTAAVELIRDLCSGRKNNHIINLRNNGAVENLPNDYVLEINTTVSEKSMRPVCIGKANKLTLGLIHTVKNFERLTIEAHIEKSLKKAKAALLIHPLGPDADRIDAMMGELLEVNKPYFNLF